MRDLRGRLRRLKELHQKYDRFVFPVALLIGFLIDSFTFQQINLYSSGILLAFYFLVIAVSIYLFHFFDREKFEKQLASGRASFAGVALSWLPVVIQYAFGGVFSAFVVFYLRSASLGPSLIFIFLLVSVLIGSEVFRKKFLRLDFQLGMFFAGLFLFLFFAISVVSGKVGTGPFLLSSVVSALGIGLLFFMLWPLVSEKFKRLKISFAASLLGVFVSINMLYFLNIIPPVPLALKKIGVYHSLERLESGRYMAEKEKEVNTQGVLGFLSEYDSKVQLISGEPLYVFTSVYAPDGVGTRIFHEWIFYSESRGKWERRDRIEFSISGGRKEGYRGYTQKANLPPGNWRVRVVTANGNVLESIQFEVERVAAPVPVEKVAL